jgi:hypothetical protein
MAEEQPKPKPETVRSCYPKMTVFETGHFFCSRALFAEIPGVFARSPRNHPATIAPEKRRNIHLYLILRRDPIMAVDCNDR